MGVLVGAGVGLAVGRVVGLWVGLRVGAGKRPQSNQAALAQIQSTDCSGYELLTAQVVLWFPGSSLTILCFCGRTWRGRDAVPGLGMHITQRRITTPLRRGTVLARIARAAHGVLGQCTDRGAGDLAVARAVQVVDAGGRRVLAIPETWTQAHNMRER